ncbi:glucose-6-phosphate dehydrogenase [Poriferisphaera sp. WC338]|uniref:glucose-6-phosphate dehydrogenase n=1 Tax=Poriferisphaera sp. WC338 TaxID=3425129 RepID=UPI003D819F60
MSPTTLNDPNAYSNCLIVIFGASGDLTKRKLIPALYSLWESGQAPKSFAILGVSRTEFTSESYRDKLFEFSKGSYDPEKWKEFSQCIYYHPGDPTATGSWKDISSTICDISEKHDLGQNRMFYLSVGPQFFEPIINNIGSSGLVTEGRRYCSIGEERPWQRIVIEKPFGSDPASAIKLNNTLAAVFDEDSIYRIDHYLGKELVQNLLVVRFANSIFEPLWNSNYIDHVQITASETVGVEGRGAYYDSPAGGAMRDMVQSHLMQVLSFMAMEPPVRMDAADIRTEKNKIFKALRVPKYEDVPKIAVRGQYGGGQISGKPVMGYRDEKGVAPESQTDTYAAMQVYVDTWRWGGVPFYLRSGKAMAEKKTEIVIYFKPTPHLLLKEEAKKQKPNQIIINVHPNEGIRLRFEGKVPGLGLKIKDVVMDFDYIKQWDVEPSDGYAILLNDVLRGDQMLFKHRDEIEISWNAVQPVLDYWADNPQDDLPNYNAGTWGPSSADIMMARDNRYWHNY